MDVLYKGFFASPAQPPLPNCSIPIGSLNELVRTLVKNRAGAYGETYRQVGKGYIRLLYRLRGGLEPSYQPIPPAW